MYGPIIYYVEVPAAEVPVPRRTAALKEVEEVCDTLGLPPIEVRWFMRIGGGYHDTDEGQAAEAIRDAWYRRTRAAFTAQGVCRRPVLHEVRQHPYVERQWDCAGFVRQHEPCVIYLQTPPSPTHIEEMQMVLDPWRCSPDVLDGVEMVVRHTLAAVIRHEMTHCYQILAGFAERLNSGQMTLEEFEHMAEEFVVDYPDLREMLMDDWRRTHPDRVLEYPGVLESGEVIWARPGWREALDDA